MNKPKKRITRIRVIRRRKGAEERVRDAFADVPRITNETVAEHREDVLAGARKYIYPLKHSRRRTVFISSTIFVTAVVIFMAYCGAALYKFQSTSGFLYGVTKVIPFPVAKAGPAWVSYNSYLFELRHYMHYYATQQNVDFATESGKQQLANYKKQALDQVVNDAYVKQLAKQHHVTVSNKAVSQQVGVVRSQNRLGTSQKQFEEVLNKFWGWDESDFRRDLQQEMLAQAVVAKLDTNTNTQAASVLQQLKAGADFGTLANQYTQDPSGKGTGGQYPAPIDRTDANVPAQVTAKLFSLQAGQYSDIINTGYALEIVKVNGVQDTKVQASHIVFNYQPVGKYLAALKAKQQPHDYIKV